MPTLVQKAAYWERELLDLSKRNRMLHFRETKRSSLVIEKPDFFSMYQSIVKDEQSLSFQHPIGRDIDPRAYYLLRLMELSGSPVDVFIGDIHTTQKIYDQMLTLRSLRNKAQLAFDEQGTNLLYLVFGFIHWYDGDKKTGDMNSPFLLVPVSFTGSGTHDYNLKLYEDDITINPTLVYALEQKRHFSFPEFDSDKDSFATYIKKLVPLLEKAGMTFEQKCCLGILSFLKINMYLDLKKNNEKITSNPVLREIYLPQANVERPQFDHDAEPYENRLQVLSADSSQMDAITLSRQGKSFVLQGPPGTGKSQTITNIIAQALADKKKVLFVSEKMAALQVVYRRLEEVGLGDFCLPLHDYKADKKQILRQIAKPLTLKKKDKNASAQAKLAQLEVLKRKLNLYPQDMHRVQSAYQMSLYEAMSRLEELQDAPAYNAGIKNAHAMDRLTVLKQQELMAEFGRTVQSMTIAPNENPWHGYRQQAFLPEEKQKIKELIEAYLQAQNDAMLLTAQAEEEYHFSIHKTPQDLQHTAALLDALLHLSVLPPVWFELNTDTLRVEAEKEKRNQHQYLENKQAADSFFTAYPPMDKVTSWLESFQRIQTGLLPFGVNMDSLKKSKQAYIEAIERLEKYIQAWESQAGIFWSKDQPIAKGQEFYDFLSHIHEASVFSAQWIQPGSRESAIQVFQSSYQHRKNDQQLQAALFSVGATAESEDAMKAAYASWKTAYPNDPTPIIGSVLENRWRVQHPSAFSSIPSFSSAAWMGNVNQLVQALQCPTAFSFDQLDAYFESCTHTADTLEKFEKLCNPFTGLFPDKIYKQFHQFFQHLPGIVTKLPVPFAWTKQSERNNIRQLLTQLISLQENIKEQRENILKDYQPSVFDLPASEMLHRFEHDYASFFGGLKPQKKKDIFNIQICRKSSATVIRDIEACRILKALCSLKEVETTYQDLWKNNADRLIISSKDMPDDWIGIKEKLADFDAFCQQEENLYIEHLTKGMLEAIPNTVSVLQSISFTEVNTVISQWIPDAMTLPVPAVCQQIIGILNKLQEMVGLFQTAASYLHEGITNSQTYHAMESLVQEQDQLLLSTMDMLRRRVEEESAFDALKEQRMELLGPAWQEDDPQWDEVNRTFTILAQANVKNAISEIAKKTPDVTLAELKQWYAGLKDFCPDQMFNIILEANQKIHKDISAKDQADSLHAGLIQIDHAIEFMDEISFYVPQQTTATLIAQHMKCLADLNELIKQQDARQDQCMLWFGDAYAGWNTDWDRVLLSLKRWHLCRAQYPEIQKNIDLYRPIIASSDRGSYERWVNRAIQVAGTWQDSYAEIDTSFDQGTLTGLTQAEKEERLAQAADHMEYLDQWLRYSMNKEKVAKEGLENVLSVFEKQNIPPMLYGQAYEKAFLLAWINQALGSCPDVEQFNAQEKDKDIGAFRKLSQDYLSINRSRLQDELIDRVPKLEAGGEMAILKKELSKKTKIMPLRKLFRQIPYLLLKLKPCLMMSPLSVSYFLDSDFYHFDMIIFDEASQIFPQDAIGAILRGDQAIIAGDTKQMPPTDFFAVDMEEEEEEDEDEINTPLGDSILEEADFTLTPQQLLWHYRSRDEQLIAFSNQHFYDDHLYTFPSNALQTTDVGVEYIYVPDGIYTKRHNDREAEMCLRLIREHFQNHPDRSLGVVAFNEAQQTAIENLVWEERENDPFFASLLDANQIEPFFIKNLENVQGDERDTIIFSICFGRAPDGKFRYNFGPLGKAGGERRLNVAVTRAKCNVKLVGSIHAQDIDLNRAKSEGARMLKYYIEYAAHRDAAGNEEGSDRDSFIDSVAQYLESQGYQIKKNVGRSSYTVDIAVCAKENPSQYIAAVQCDGSNYASARTACDREVIRQDMLENLNWRIIHCWSADWFAHPSAARKALMDQLKTKKSAKPVKTVQQSFVHFSSDQDQVPQEVNLSDIPIAASQLPEYQTASNMRYLSSEYPAKYSEYMKRILHCIRYEQPISLELLYKRMAPLWDRQVASSYVRDQVNERLEKMRDAVKLIHGYYTLVNFMEAQARTAGDREIDQIYPDELEADLAFVIQQAYGMERQEVITATARMMGYQRTGQKIISHLNEALDRLQAKNKITIVHDKVQWKE